MGAQGHGIILWIRANISKVFLHVLGSFQGFPADMTRI